VTVPDEARHRAVPQERADATIAAPPAARPTRAVIDLDAIAHNVRLFRDRPHTATIVAVVKADGYGHGAVPVARAALAAGAEWLAVALIEEGEELRAAGITVPVLLLSEPPAEAADRVVASDLTPTLYTLPFSEALRREAAKRSRHIRVHVKADTGMSRVGIPRHEWDRGMRNLSHWPELEVEAFWTHFACADQPGHPSIARQQREFEAFLELARTHGFKAPLTHWSNSAAALTLDEQRDAIRLGIAMYGLAPSAELADAADLRPALSLITEVSYAKDIEAGTAVSYGHTWEAPTDGRLVTLPLGYADGVPRLLSNRAEVLIRGQRRPIVGNVCMDQLLVWCGDDDVRSGEEVVLLGRQGDEEVTALEWAEIVGTITYEIATGVSPRVPRLHVRTGRA
jgi:alanine racemase